MPLLVKPALSLVIADTPMTPLSKDQKAFNTLVQKIKRRREKLTTWQAVLSQIHQQVADELLPLQQTLADLQLELAIALDAAYTAKSTTKAEKRKIAAMIVVSTESVLAFHDNDRAKTLYNQYTMSDFDAEEAERLAAMTAMLEDTLGIDLSEATLDFADELSGLKKNPVSDDDAAQPKQSPKDAAKLAKREAEEKQLSQSIRDVFRKLVSALHPDRERDFAERERKTALMQRVNDAYEKGNLLQLLELQLEVEQIDQDHMATVQPDRLKHYIKIFRGQLKDLEDEIKSLENDFALRLGLSPLARVEPGYLLDTLRHDIADLRIETAEITRHLEEICDPGRLKSFLRHMTMPRRRADDFF